MNKKLLLLFAAFQIMVGVGLLSAAKRVVSLSPSLTLNIRYLGDEKELVGCTSYCKTTSKITVVATAIKVNVEKVYALKPDLVVASSMTSPETISSLKKLGLNVVVFPMPRSFAEICTQFDQLGKLLQCEVKAKRIISDSQRRIAAIKVNKKNNRKVFIQLGVNPIFAVIPNTFMNDYILFSGSKNIAEGMTSGSITRESVLLRNPDALFIVTMGPLGEEEKKQWETYPNLTARRNKQIFLIDSEKACIPTPVTFVETLELIARLMNK